MPIRSACFAVTRSSSAAACASVCIGMALATDPKLLIADEPGTSLDVTIQDQVLRLLRRLVEEHNTSVILITHTLGIGTRLLTGFM